MTELDAVTLALAAVGAVLGVINTWHEINQSWLRLRVAPMVAYPYGTRDNRPRLTINVANLSTFPVTITLVGFTLQGSTDRLVDPAMRVFETGQSLPFRLEPHAAMSVHLSPGFESSAQFKFAHRAFATTASGERKLSAASAVRRLQPGL